MDRVLGAGRGIVAGAAAIAAIAALAGCAQLQTVAQDMHEAARMEPMGVDPSSPVAADVARAEAVRGPLPSFASVPPRPTDVRAAGAYKKEVLGVVADRRALSRWEAANPPAVNDTEAWAEAQRQRLAKERPVAPEKQAESEAFAKKLREAAQAPQPKPN